jgi:hypothetical protein
MAIEYEYELRQGESVIATGRLVQDEPLSVGDRVTVSSKSGIIKSLLPPLGGRPTRITIQLSRSTL